MKKQILLILCLFISVYAGCVVNPITGEEEFILYSEDTDREIGVKYAPEIEKELGGKIENDQLQDYIQQVGLRVARQSHRPYIDYQFAALNDEMMNAFALPGGFIFITRGMLEKMETEAQLAAILGHETAHVVARDTANAMSKQIGMNLLLVGVASGTDAPAGAIRAADLALQIISLKYSRDDERIADIAGMDYMVKAGYNPIGMVETMQLLKDESDVRPIEFFSTHPDPQNRIQYLKGLINNRYASAQKQKIGKSLYQDNVTAILEKMPPKNPSAKQDD